MIRRLTFLLTLLLTFAGTTQAANIYFAQSSAGGNTGADCANARAFSSHVIGDDVAGNTLHLCGTFTAGAAGTPAFTILASGSAGSPITVIMESGAILESPEWPGNSQLGTCSSNCGGLQAINKQFIIFDGGTNGIVRNTLAGSSTKTCLGGTCNQGNSSVGVFASGSNNIIRNFHINNIYISCGATNCTDTNTFSGTAGIRVDAGSTNTNICGNTITQAYQGISTDTADSVGAAFPPACSSNATPSGVNLFANTITNACHHFEMAGQGAINVSMNDVSDWTDWIWPGSGSGCHTDGLITYSNGATVMTPNIFDNYFHGDLGQGSPTAFVFCTYNGTNGGSACTVFNNLMVGTGSLLTGNDNLIWAHSNSTGPHKYYNNTLLYSGDIISMDGDTTTHFTFKNNIFVGNAGTTNTYAWKSQSANQAWATLDAANNNDFFSLRPSGGWNWNGQTGTSLANWTSICKTGTGGGAGTCDDASTTGDPKLDGSNHLQVGSAAIALGANLTGLGITPLNSGAPSTFGVGSTFNGVARPSSGAWDAGAFQTGSPGPAPTPSGGVIISAVPLPATTTQPTLVSISPTKTYVNAKGCSQNGVKWLNPCIFAITCTNCSATTTLSIDGTMVNQTYASNVMTTTVPLSLLPVPSQVTLHNFTATNPSAVPVLQ